MIYYGCSQPRELWFIDFNHVYATISRVPCVYVSLAGFVHSRAPCLPTPPTCTCMSASTSVNSCCVSSPRTTTTTLCVLYDEPCTTCYVAFLYIPIHVGLWNVLCCASLYGYKTHDCANLLYTACGSSTTTNGITPARPKCLALHKVMNIHVYVHLGCLL